MLAISKNSEDSFMDTAKKRKLEGNGVHKSDVDVSRLTAADVRKIIDTFSHDQLLEIIQNAAIHHVDVLDNIRSFADRDATQRKLFIRGLGWETTTEKLSKLFSEYGDLEEAIVIVDKVTGRSKGYGFVTFKHVDGALLGLKDPSKKIDGRITVTQLAILGNSGSSGNVSAVDVSARKIYVANVPMDMSSERLLGHFSSYGEIEEGPLGFDKQTGKSRGFALFVYKTAESAKASLVDPTKTIDGHQLICKLAIDGRRIKPGQMLPPGSVAIQSSIQGSIAPGVHSGMPTYSGFSGGGIHPPLNHQNSEITLSVPTSLGQVQSSYDHPYGGQYMPSVYGSQTGSGHGGGLIGTDSGIMINSGNYGPPLPAFGNTVCAVFDGSSSLSAAAAALYGRLPSNNAPVNPGGYHGSTNYNVQTPSVSGHSVQHNQAGVMSPAPRGGTYHGMPTYY